MNMKYSHLFQPLQVNSMMLRNRIVFSPMGINTTHKIISSTGYGGMSAWDRGNSGAGMVHIAPLGTNLFAKYELDNTKEWINVAKQDGAKVSCEVEFFSMQPDQDGYIYGPMDGVRFDGAKMKAFTEETMQQLIDKVCQFSVNCRKIGFDAITVHIGHDSLCSQFLSPVWNQRTDEYGGSLENRMRFPVRFLTALRKAVGPDYPIIARLSRQLIVKETYCEDDMLQFVKAIDGIVDMVNISCGMDVYHDGNVHAVPTIFEPHQYNKEFARRVKQETNLKVCLVGAVMNAAEGEEAIAEGYADCCMFGRSAIADPYWPKKIMQGKEEDIVPCIRCMHCYHIATEHWNTQCSVNPRFRRENRMALTQPIETTKKHVVIIGGGVSGMCAALAADSMGHQVTLLEKEDHLGGLLNWAAKGPFKQDLRNYFDYLLVQMNKSNIDIRLNCEANKEILEQLNPDRLIIAIGSDGRSLPIEGKERMTDCLDAIDHPEQLGQKVVIIGGGSIGCEQALEIALTGRDVTIVEMMNDVALNGNHLYRVALMQHFNKQDNIEILTNTRCQRIEEDGVVVVCNGEERKLPYDSVINAVGRVSKNREAMQYYGVCCDTVMIGDCERVGSIIDATNIAYFVGRSV